MAEEPTPSVRPGQLIDGKYRVERVLGQGGMAVVVAARHIELDELVAIKVILPQRVSSADARERFAREARAAVKIKSEHVARVMDVGALDDGSPYMVMEYLDGEDFAAVLERRKKIPVAEAIEYALQITDALTEAHSLGIIHRDVKPANLFLAQTRNRPATLKVLDFGISKVEHHDRRKTETKEILGSPWYMAPEQLKSATSADPRSDIWSLGIILYEFVTGEVPFDGDSMTEVIVKVLHDQLPHGKLPRQLEPVIRRCLAKSPQARYDNMDQVAAALRALESTYRSSSIPPPAVVRKPGTVPRPAPAAAVEILLGADDVELIDNPPDTINEEDDGAVVDDAELLPSDPPPRADDGTTPIALPLVAFVAPAAVVPAVVLESASELDPPITSKVEEAERARNTGRLARPPPDALRPPPKAGGRARFVLIGGALLVAVAVGANTLRGRPPTAPAPSTSVAAMADTAPPDTSSPSIVTPQPTGAPPEIVAAVDSSPIVAPLVAAPAASAPVAARLAAAPARVVAIAAVEARPKEAPPPEDDASVAYEVARRHNSTLKQVCWEASGKTTAVVSVAASVDPSGAVTSASASAADPQLAQCVAGQVRTWTFPASTKARSLTIPIRFRR